MLLGMSALISVQARIYNAQREQDTTKLFAISKEGLLLLLVNGAKDGYLPGEMAYEVLSRVEIDRERESHVLFMKNLAEVMVAIGDFAKRPPWQWVQCTIALMFVLICRLSHFFINC